MIELGLAVGASVGWGASEFVAGLAARTRPTVLVLAGSQVASLVLLAAMLPATGFEAPPAHGIWLAAAAGLFEVLGFAALYRALASGPMGPVAPFAALGGLVPLGASFAGGGTLPPAALFGIVLGLVGIVLVSWDGDGEVAAAEARPLTVPLLLAGASSVCFGCFFLLLQRATVHADPVSAVAICRVTAVAVTLPLIPLVLRDRGLGTHGRRPISWSRDLTLMAVIGALDVGANLLYALVTSRSDAVGLQIIASASPVATVLLAVIVLRERMNRVQAVGAGAAIAAVLLIGGG